MEIFPLVIELTLVKCRQRCGRKRRFQNKWWWWPNKIGENYMKMGTKFIYNWGRVVLMQRCQYIVVVRYLQGRYSSRPQTGYHSSAKQVQSVDSEAIVAMLNDPKFRCGTGKRSVQFRLISAPPRFINVYPCTGFRFVWILPDIIHAVRITSISRTN